MTRYEHVSKTLAEKSALREPNIQQVTLHLYENICFNEMISTIFIENEFMKIKMLFNIKNNFIKSTIDLHLNY